MSAATITRPYPRVALEPNEAANSLGVKLTFFKEHIAPDLRVVRIGAKRLYPVRELERWVEDQAEQVIDHAD